MSSNVYRYSLSRMQAFKNGYLIRLSYLVIYFKYAGYIHFVDVIHKDIQRFITTTLYLMIVLRNYISRAFQLEVLKTY